MLIQATTRCLLYFVLAAIIIFICQPTAVSHPLNRQINPWDMSIPNSEPELRYRRAIGKAKPGFFWTLGSSIFQQFNETKNAYQQIRRLLNDQFLDERRPAKISPPTTTSPPPTGTGPTTTTTTTQAPFKITRNEFNRILMRNLRGLVRLYNLELDAANKQSVINRAEFNKQLRTSIKEQLS